MATPPPAPSQVGLLVTSDALLLLTRRAGDAFWSVPMAKLADDQDAIAVAQDLAASLRATVRVVGPLTTPGQPVVWVHGQLEVATLDGLRHDPEQRLAQADWADFAWAGFTALRKWALDGALDRCLRAYSYNLYNLLLSA